MNTRTFPKTVAALGAIVVTVAASLMATGAGATRDSNAAAVARAASPQRLLPADAGAVSAFAFDPRDPNTVYVGTIPGYNKGRVYKSTDAGGRWKLISGPGWTWVGALASDPKHPATLYASTSTGIHKTTDGGRTWQAFSRGLLPPSGVASGEGSGRLAVDPNNSNIIYAGLGLSVHKSVNAGHSWQTVLSGKTERRLMLVAATRPTTIYAAFFIKNTSLPPYTPVLAVESSTDGGKTWQRTRLHVALKRNDPYGIYDLGADPGSPTTLYAAVQARVFVSTDAGRSWRSIRQGLPQDSDATSLVAGPGTVYAAFGKGGLYQTTDGGQTWRRSWPQTETAPGLGVSIVAIDPARPTTVYASAYYPSGRATGTHILRSTDSGHTWTVAG
jgi:photosystem II stability/assembly factor-like uncharacterized protein